VIARCIRPAQRRPDSLRHGRDYYLHSRFGQAGNRVSRDRMACRKTAPHGGLTVSADPNRVFSLMQAPLIDMLSLARAGVDALRRGDALAARESFERIVATGRADASACVGLAYACRSLKDYEASKAAVDKALALEP